MNAAQQPLVLMMAGGTGGHVYPALAVARDLLGRGYRVEWVGTHRGLEHRVVPGAGIKLHFLPVRGVRGKSLLHRLLGVLFLLFASIKALWLVLRLAPRCVVGMGGYVAGPAGVAAWLWRKPLLIHEQNAVAGTTNRMLAPLASRILAGFSGAFSPEVACTVVGNPVRRELVEAAAANPYGYAGDRPLRLLVLGGSLGDAHATEVRTSYGDRSDDRIRVVPFIEDMAAAYAWADLVVCRSGALTVAELAVMGRPAILVPLPHAIDDHQTANARSLTECGGAVLLRQADLTADSLAQALRDCIARPPRLAAMAAAAQAAARPDATARVADCCEELIHDR